MKLPTSTSAKSVVALASLAITTSLSASALAAPAQADSPDLSAVASRSEQVDKSAGGSSDIPKSASRNAISRRMLGIRTESEEIVVTGDKEDAVGGLMDDVNRTLQDSLQLSSELEAPLNLKGRNVEEEGGSKKDAQEMAEKEADCEDDEEHLARRQVSQPVGMTGFPGQMVGGVEGGQPGGAVQNIPTYAGVVYNGVPVPIRPDYPMQDGFPFPQPPTGQTSPLNVPMGQVNQVAENLPSPVSGISQEAQAGANGNTLAPFSEVAGALQGAAGIPGAVQNTPGGAVYNGAEGVIGGAPGEAFGMPGQIIGDTPFGGAVNGIAGNIEGASGFPFGVVNGLPGVGGAAGTVGGVGGVVGGVVQNAPLGGTIQQTAGGLPIIGGELNGFGFAEQGAAKPVPSPPQPPQAGPGNVTSHIPLSGVPPGAPVSAPVPLPSGAPNPIASGLPAQPSLPISPPDASPPVSPPGSPPIAPPVSPPSAPVDASAPVPVPSGAPIQPPSALHDANEQDISSSPSSTTATPSSSPQFEQDNNHEDEGFMTTATPTPTPLMAAFANLPGPASDAPELPVGPPTSGLPAPIPAPSGAPAPPPLLVHPPVSGAPSLPVQPPSSFPVQPPVPTPSVPAHPSVSPPVAPPGAPVSPPSALPVQPPVSSLPVGVPSPPANLPKPPASLPAGVPRPPVPPPAPAAAVTSAAPNPPMFIRARRPYWRRGTGDDAEGPVKMKRGNGSRDQLPLPSGFLAPTAPISGDTPPLLKQMGSGTNGAASSPTGSVRARAYAYFAPSLSKMTSRAAAAAAGNHGTYPTASTSSMAIATATTTAEKEKRSGRRRLFRFSRFFAGEGDHND